MPSVGRIVHYRGLPRESRSDAEWHPAIITKVLDDTLQGCLNLQVLFDAAPVEFRLYIEHESYGGERAWRWPPRT